MVKTRQTKMHSGNAPGDGEIISFFSATGADGEHYDWDVYIRPKYSNDNFTTVKVVRRGESARLKSNYNLGFRKKACEFRRSHDAHHMYEQAPELHWRTLAAVIAHYGELVDNDALLFEVYVYLPKLVGGDPYIDIAVIHDNGDSYVARWHVKKQRYVRKASNQHFSEQDPELHARVETILRDYFSH